MYECALKLCYLQLFAAIFSLIRSCVCVCACEKERERQRDRHTERETETERDRERSIGNNDLTEKFKALDNCI